MAIDQGTTSSRTIIFRSDGTKLATEQAEFPQYYPSEGWVEHDPREIWQSTLETARTALKKAESQGGEVISIGMTNQRETVVLWDRQTGEPLHKAIVWQDRRTAGRCAELKSQDTEALVRERTGLVLDPYFSATKIEWLLDHVDGARDAANAGKVAAGTIDTWLLWQLTGGKIHATDATNASRTSLLNIATGNWDPDLLELFNIPPAVLPDVKNSADDFGVTDPDLFGRAIPIGGIAGDQQAAAIGQGCFAPGDIKSTYGTGCFILAQTGKEIVHSGNGLLSTIALQLNGNRHYAVEGSIFVTGAGIQWLRDMLGFIESAAETEELAKSVPGTNGVYIVPAFAGLGAPYWKPDARGLMTGLSRGTTKAEIVRAMLESVAYQTNDLIRALKEDGVMIHEIKVDGGMTANDWLCQFIADIVDTRLIRPQNLETTALGAAALAGVQAGLIDGLEGIKTLTRPDREFSPQIKQNIRQNYLDGWHKAVRQTMTG